MENNPQVAIMMPVYNGEKTLSLAISSLIHQTYNNWKCYIVNDGSTDRTKEILDNLKDERFIVIHFETNKGRPYARQAVLDKAEGKYLAMLDADDFYHPEKLEIQVNFLEKHPESVLVSSGMGSFKNLDEGLLRFRGVKDIIDEKFIPLKSKGYVHAASMLRLESAKQVKYDLKLKHSEDMDFLGRLLVGRKYSSIPKILYYYSEFDSVGKYKIWKTYYYGILRYLKFLKSAPLFIIKKLLVVIMKWILLTITLPFISVDKILANRGKKPTQEMLIEFTKVLKEYGIKN